MEPASEGLFRTFVQFRDEGQYHHRCMHCEKPVCVGNCQAEPKALSKSDYGPVLYDPQKCIGCQACVESCPYGVPQYFAKTSKIVKCSMCADKVGRGQPPACVTVCPSGVFKFGERAPLLKEAKALAAKRKLHLYGEKTSVFILTKLPPAKLGYPKEA